LKLFLSEEGYWQDGMPVLLRQRSRVVSYRPRRVLRGAWRGEGGGGKKTRAGREGKRRKTQESL